MRKFTLLSFLFLTSMLFAQVTTIPGIVQKGYTG